MIVHILVDIPQKARRDDTDSTRRNTRQVNILIALPKVSSEHGLLQVWIPQALVLETCLEVLTA